MSERITTERAAELLALWTERAEAQCDDPSGVEYDLAREVIAAHAERDEARESAALDQQMVWALGETRERLLAECARLQAIVDGRGAPTEAEVRAHAASGGRWLHSCEMEAGRRLVYVLDRGWEDALGEARRPSPGSRWWALAANGAPCVWPVAT